MTTLKNILLAIAIGLALGLALADWAVEERIEAMDEVAG